MQGGKDMTLNNVGMRTVFTPKIRMLDEEKFRGHIFEALFEGILSIT